MTTSSFPHDYEVVVDPEFPADGVWPAPVFVYDRVGRPAADGVAWHGIGVTVLVSLTDGTEWVATFPAGQHGADGVHAAPSPEHLCVLVGGDAHLVQVTAPGAGAPVVLEQVEQVAASVEPPLLLLVGDLGLVALGPDGLSWRAEEWPALENTRIRRADAKGITCAGTAWDDSDVEFVIGPVNGRLVEAPPEPPWAPPTASGQAESRRKRWWQR